MIINSLRAQHIRNHPDFSCRLSPRVTIIAGNNGSGKTSIIEAIYTALRGTSFRGTDKDMLEYGQGWWRIDLKLEDGATRSAAFDSSRQTGRKKFIVDDKTFYRLPVAQKHPVVLFEPDDLRLIHGSPARRRVFIDTFISQLDHQYGANLRKYERALKQRNALLKRQFTAMDDLFVWNVALSEYGAAIVQQRVYFIEQLNSQLNEAYNDIAHSKDDISVHYSETLIGNTKQKIMSELHAGYERDRVLGYTSVGPHRHDVVFKLNNSPAVAAASRGETRTMVLALKFLEVAMIERITDKKPVILLDDVFGELDHERQLHLTSAFADKQVVITSATSIPPTSNSLTLNLVSD